MARHAHFVAARCITVDVQPDPSVGDGPRQPRPLGLAAGATPHAARLQLEADGKTVRRDANGNALRGVRTVFVDVPTATIVPTSLAPGGVLANPCAYLGYQPNFTDRRLAQLFRSHAGYVTAVRAEARRPRLVASRGRGRADDGG